MAIRKPEEREEVMKASTHTRWIKRVALGLAVAAIAAPSAHGAYEELYQHRFSDGTPVEPLLPDLSQLEQFRFTPSNELVGPTVVIPDPARGLPSVDDLQQFRFTPDPIVTPVASAPSSGIDWMDAGIGAGMALGAIVLGAAAALGLRRRGLAHS
jgi:hypothetical protein